MIPIPNKRKKNLRDQNDFVNWLKEQDEKGIPREEPKKIIVETYPDETRGSGPEFSFSFLKPSYSENYVLLGSFHIIVKTWISVDWEDLPEDAQEDIIEMEKLKQTQRIKDILKLIVKEAPQS